MKPVFIFDMDGVLIDSVELMYYGYANFLSKFGITGTREEFAKRVNGPKIEEIVAILKRIYNLPCTHEELLVRYDHEMQGAYAVAHLMPGVKEALQELRKRGYAVAIASSSKLENIKRVIEKHGIANDIDVVISGDDVARAKPAPDIYLKARAALPGARHIVLEDSDNGMTAAASAGMEVIFFNPSRRKSASLHQHEIGAMAELTRVLDENRSPFIAQASTISFVPHEAPSLTPEQENAVERAWSEALKDNPSLFDREVVSYASHELTNGGLVIHYFTAPYKRALAQLKHPDLKLNIFPLAVSGMMLDANKNTLIARRSETVTQYPGWHELVPSGGIPAAMCDKTTIRYQEQLAQELLEEAGIPQSSIHQLSTLGLIHEKDYGVYVIACIIRLKDLLETHRTSSWQEEYSSFTILPNEKLPEFLEGLAIVPTTRTIAKHVLSLVRNIY